MSYGTEARVNTVSYALTNEQTVPEGLNGKTPLVASEATQFEHGSPNPDFFGAQPDTLTPSGIEDVSTDTYSAKHARLELAEQPPVINPAHANAYEWKARFQHVPDAPNGWLVEYEDEDAFGEKRSRTVKLPPTAQGGHIMTETLVMNNTEPVADETVDGPAENVPADVFSDEEATTIILPVSNEETQERGRTRWYNPREVSIYAWTRLAHPETWSRRATTAAVLGSMATTAVGGALMWHGMKNGTDHNSVAAMFGKGHAPDNTGGTWHAPDTPAAPPHEVPMPSTPHGQTPEHTPAPEPVYRTAVSYDVHTHRPSTAYDWSQQALAEAGKDAKLSPAELDWLTHDAHSIHTVNHALYADNPELGHNPRHLLDANTRYDISGEQTAAHNIANSIEPRPHIAMDVSPAEQAPHTPGTITPDVMTDKQLADILKQIENDPLYHTPAAPAPALRHEVFMHFTAQELQNISAAIGTVTVGTAIGAFGSAGVAKVYQARHRRKLQNERENEWGSTTSIFGTQGKKIRSRRAYDDADATVPEGMSPYDYWEKPRPQHEAVTAGAET